MVAEGQGRSAGACHRHQPVRVSLVPEHDVQLLAGSAAELAHRLFGSRAPAQRRCELMAGRGAAAPRFGTRSGKLFGSADEGETWSALADGLPPVISVKAAVV